MVWEGKLETSRSRKLAWRDTRCPSSWVGEEGIPQSIPEWTQEGRACVPSMWGKVWSTCPRTFPETEGTRRPKIWEGRACTLKE